MSCEVILEVVEEVYELLEVAEKGDPGTPAVPVDHNDLTAIQGGTVTERYHLTAAEVAQIATNAAKVSFPEAPNDGKQYARESLAWSEVAAGGGGGEWELVTTEKPSVTVGEVLFTALDFDLYDYRLTGRIVPSGNTISGVHWYSHEANAAAVAPTNYEAHRAWSIPAFGSSDSTENFFLSLAKSLQAFATILFESTIARSDLGYIVAQTRAWNTGRGVNLKPFTILDCQSYDDTVDTGANKFGLYFIDGIEFLTGSEFLLYRRPRPTV